MDLQLNSFRCFSSTGRVPIRPITLLVGENSTGKTSFQAALRYLLAMGSFGATNTFNSPPFQLGGFDDIAFSKVGRKGVRAKHFSLKFTLEKSQYQANGGHGMRRAEPIPDNLEFHLRFSEWLAQPALDTFAVRSKEHTIRLDLLKNVLHFERDGVEPISLEMSEQVEEFLKLLRLNVNQIGSLFSSILFLTAHTDSKETMNFGFLKARSEPIAGLHPFNAIANATQNYFFNPSQARGLIAFSPIRSEPQRTYELLDDSIVISPTGAHVPGALAQAKIRDESRWKSYRSYLTDFGKASGLFSNIDIRKLGTSQADPFQILVTLGGSKHNIVDVGYGVSQALPVLYEMAPSIPKTLLMQQPEVHLHPRAQSQLGLAIVDAFRTSNHRFVVETHSDYIVDRIRNSIMQEKIATSDVALLYFERDGSEATIKEINLDRFGNVINPPSKYRDFFYREEKDLLGI